MAYTRNSTTIKQELINYIASLGLNVYTGTKARGNKGFFKKGRIDISKSLTDSDAIRTILHEYAHFVHYNLDKNLKDFFILFKNSSEELKEELMDVTRFVDENSTCCILYDKRKELNTEIKKLIEDVQQEYSDFKPNEKLKAFKRYSSLSNIRYLEKYDSVKIHRLTSSRVYSIKDIKKDFPETPEVFIKYLELKSLQRQRDRITRKISKLNRYYLEPTELFARFIEGIYIDMENIKDIAPQTFQIFKELYSKNYYKGMREIFSIVDLII